MIDPKILDELSKRFTEIVPASVRQLQTDMEKNFHAVLQATFAKMDLVTREEFDVQQAVLARTRTKLENLEKQVASLEDQLQTRRGKSSANPPDTAA
ncbi:MAG: accessory factor UbiK family protein [Candidatus Competibacteraceae bacterium]|jgi:BMFP domain-containing protein YqiC|nr:accessory factor UbiK family protein [Candidatus Competibacteraceae bacterium]